MVLHAASFAAFFVLQTQQAPIHIQCVQQSTPEPTLKWLLPTIVQTVVSLLSIFAGVGIAVRSFRANKKSEHEQWIRDQKKAEWQELLMATAHMRRMLSLGLESPQTRAKQIREGLKPVVQELEVSAANCVFLRDFFVDEAKSKRFYSFLYDADLNAEKMNILFQQTQCLQNPPHMTHLETVSANVMNEKETVELVDTIAQKFIGFNDWLRKEAVEDLVIASPKK
jgi:hypothetical protein